MEIEVKTEDDDGNVVFEGKLSSSELNFVIGIGLNYLLAQGALPFMSEEEEDSSILAPGSDGLQ